MSEPIPELGVWPEGMSETDWLRSKITALIASVKQAGFRIHDGEIRAERKPSNPMNIVIQGLTEAQRLAISDMLRQWVLLGGMGSSRWVAFYADGDGNFHPKITVDGAPPESFGTKEEVQARWKPDFHGEYRIDFDEIGWKLHAKQEAATIALGPAETTVPHTFRVRTDFDGRCGFRATADRFCLRPADDPAHNYPTADDPSPKLPAEDRGDSEEATQ